VDDLPRLMHGYRVVGINAQYNAARQGEIHGIMKELYPDNPVS
jgi:hypothetical protein